MDRTINLRVRKVSVSSDLATVLELGPREQEDGGIEVPQMTLRMPNEDFLRLFKNWMPEYIGDATIEVTVSLPDEGSAPAHRYLHPLKLRTEVG